MSADPGSWLTATGFAFMLFGVSAGVGSGELGVLLGLLGVLIGANFIAAGVRRMDEDSTTPTSPAALAVLGAFTAFLRRNLAVVGIMLSFAAINSDSDGEAGPVLCLAMFALLLLGLCFINIGGTTMTTVSGSWLTAIGFAIMLLGVSVGVGSSESGLLLGLLGVLVGANTIAAGVRRMGEDPTTPTSPAVLGAFTAFLRRNLAVVGIILSSSAVTSVSGGEVGPVLCCAMFALLLLGPCLVSIRVLGE